MYDNGDSHFTRDFPFGAVNRFVSENDVVIGGNLGMQGGYGAGRTIIVNNDVVYADDVVIRKDACFEFLYHFWRRRLTQEGVDGIKKHLNAANENK